MYSRLLVTFQVLIAAESFVAAGIVTLAHGSTNDIDGTFRFPAGDLAVCPDLGTLQLSGLSLNLVYHHLAVSTEASRRRGSM